MSVLLYAGDRSVTVKDVDLCEPPKQKGRRCPKAPAPDQLEAGNWKLETNS